MFTFTRLFERSNALGRHPVGPFAEERARFLQHYSELGMSRSSLRHAAQYLLGAESYLRLTDNPGKRFTLEEIEAAGERWSKRQCLPPVRVSPRLSKQRFVCVARRWLRFMGRLEEPIRVGPLDSLLAEFAEFLRVERSLAPITIESRCWIISKCLAGIPSEHALQVFTVADLDALLLHKVVDGGYSRSTVSLWASTLRSFFRYGESRGWCKPGIAAAIMAPRVFTDETLPSGPRWEDVRRLLKSSERDSPAGIRDYAILLVFAIYGVRAGEVARLCLDDINWTKETITFARSKVHRRDCFPLISVAGDALIRYLREARPKTTDRRVFLTAQAPIRPVTSGTLCAIVTRPLRALGIDLKHYGPHALRHACATHLINQGLSLKEIGDHLGHRDADSTRIYAKVDLKHLREIARFDLGGVL